MNNLAISYAIKSKDFKYVIGHYYYNAKVNLTFT